MKTVENLVSVLSLAVATIMLPGCYEEMDASPQPQTQRPSSSGNANEGLIAPMQQTGSSALGKAKTSATNIVEQAERESQRVADQADDIVNNGNKTDDDEDQ